VEAQAPLILGLLAETPDITVEELRLALATRGHVFGYGALQRFSQARRWEKPRSAIRRSTASRRATSSVIFSQQTLQGRHGQHRLGQELLKPAVLVLERLQLLGVRNVEPAVLRLPTIKVCGLIPCRRQTSSVVPPASCSRNTPMICASVNLLSFTSASLG
jgi:hypothetical protein